MTDTNFWSNFIFLNAEKHILDRNCFSRIGLRFFFFKKESRKLFHFLNAVYCCRGIFISGPCETVTENGNMQMRTTGVQNKCFWMLKSILCMLLFDSFLWRLSIL